MRKKTAIPLQTYGSAAQPTPIPYALRKVCFEPYEAVNASHLLGEQYRDKDGYWYGIYKGVLGIMVNKDELARLNLEAPKDWQNLLKPGYEGLIWLSNYNTAGRLSTP